jgi:hypothetical protein
MAERAKGAREGLPSSGREKATPSGSATRPCAAAARSEAKPRPPSMLGVRHEQKRKPVSLSGSLLMFFCAMRLHD